MKQAITRAPGLLARCLLAASLVFGSAPAIAAETLRFGHAYEPGIAYHVWALWAADEIRRRTDGRYEIEVFPQSQLGSQPEMAEQINLGTLDMGYVGPSFLAEVYPPIQVHLAAFLWKDYDHFQKYQGSDIQKRLISAYEKESGNKILGLTYYGARHATSNKPLLSPADMKGLKIRVPPSPVYNIFPESAGASPGPLAFAEVYLALRQGTFEAQENPLPTIQAKKFHEVQSNINLTGHMLDGFFTVVNGGVWDRMSAADRRIFSEVYSEAARNCGNDIRNSELALASWFREQGVSVNEVDREAFKRAALPLIRSDKYGWSAEHIDEILKLAE